MAEPRVGLSFGLVPHFDDEPTHRHFEDLCRRLGALLDCTITPRFFGAPRSLATAVGVGALSLAWVSPTLFLSSRELAGATPLVSTVRQGHTTYHSVLFVARESPIRTLADARGARVAWVAPSSAAGYLVPRMELARFGIDPSAAFAAETFHDSHGAVATAILEGRADVGATFAVFEGGDATRRLLRAGFLERPGGEGVRIVHATGPIPSDLVVAGRTVDAERCASLAAALTGLAAHGPSREALLAVFGADGFARFRPDALASLREVVEAGMAWGLLDGPG